MLTVKLPEHLHNGRTAQMQSGDDILCGGSAMSHQKPEDVQFVVLPDLCRIKFLSHHMPALENVTFVKCLSKCLYN